MDKKVVAVSGYFDPIHIGHIELFKRAKELVKNGKLVVILNTDDQAKLKKGKVFMPMEQRKIILESIKYVDKVFVSIDKDKTVCRSLFELRPNIFANGGDRHIKEIPETDVCRKFDIEMVDSLGKKIQSSSELVGDWRK